MIKTLHGRIRGRTIELDEDLEASDGQEVIVQVRMVPAPSRTASEGSDRRQKVLIVADSATDSHATRTLLEQNGYQVDTATNGLEALGMIAEGHCDIVITDMATPETDGLDLIRRIKQASPSLPVIFVTQRFSEELAISALRCGAASYMPKQNLQRDLLPTLSDIVLAAQSHQCLTVTLIDGIK
jgi:CheY-like chemotaxis protein